MKFAFGTRPHYIISLKGMGDIALHTGSGESPNALGPASHESVTNALDDLFQRMNQYPTKLWGVVLEKNGLKRGSAATGGWWITICQQDEENGIENDTLNVIAEGTPVDIYNQLMPHLHMLRGVT